MQSLAIAERPSLHERYRQRVVSAFVLIYLFILFEGILRKWLLPGLSSVIYFIKDPIVIYIYGCAFRFGFFSRNLLSAYFIGLLVVFFFVVGAFLLSSPEGFVIYGYGVRNYLLYFPLIFVAGKTLRRVDVYRFARITLFAAIPICVLVVLQYSSGPEAYVNKGIGDDDFIFMIADGVVRPYGTFTFTAGHVVYVSACFAFLVAAIFDKALFQAVFARRFLLFGASAVSVAVMCFLTGSRSIYAYAAIVLLAALMVALIKKSQRNLLALFFLVTALVVSLLIFMSSDSYQILVERNRSAVASEGSPVARAFSSLYAFTKVVDDAPLWGHGIGSGTNAASTLLRAGREQGAGFLLAEDEWSRIVLEMGLPIGGLFILFRVFVLVWLFLKSYRALVRQGTGVPLLLCGFLAPILFNGVMTMQGTFLAFGVLYACLILAACKNT
ncbi:O-antigen ligase domain-containing protein [Pseudomonas sp. WS 5106]|uniref:O-antigen ligase domain-containing protein n=1 Tax=Pseudomonas cremoris TaxID=2724178 RepID=A0A7X1AN09_9PSED|nr:O-antigen ligase family protein [Pseudomonas cremoris]MBC2381386.1 O-antigen ligase domain-containing protein [Pseudomonas cremoris]MBC2407375.1 O-antigen ligase domain-containing protein [Pseudomonas cremoris]